ncbi:MAG: DUF1667 domain-containing protein [Clostridia bacterium]|nr:DUF1667 domain-containing protein [Clostridia bacterium]
MITKEITCTVCPRGCTVTVTGEGSQIESVTGYGCKRGETYAAAEFTNPVRLLTSTMKVSGSESELLPVRSAKPVPKSMLFDCMEVIKNNAVALPVKLGDVLIADICGSGVDIIASKSME